MKHLQWKNLLLVEGTTAGHIPAAPQDWGRAGSRPCCFKKILILFRVDGLIIVLVIVSSLFFVAFSFIVLVIQRVYTVFHPVELFHRCH